jgi:hypothetical protein
LALTECVVSLKDRVSRTAWRRRVCAAAALFVHCTLVFWASAPSNPATLCRSSVSFSGLATWLGPGFMVVVVVGWSGGVWFEWGFFFWWCARGAGERQPHNRTLLLGCECSQRVLQGSWGTYLTHSCSLDAPCVVRTRGVVHSTQAGFTHARGLNACGLLRRARLPSANLFCARGCTH